MMSRGCCEQMQDIFSIQTYFQKIIFKLTLILIYFYLILFIFLNKLVVPYISQSLHL